MKLLGILIVMTTTISLYNKALSQQVEGEVDLVNLFEYKKATSSAGFDFDNFCKNFSACISNSDQIDFLGCEYKGKVKSSVHAMALIGRNIYHGAPAWGVSSAYKDDDGHSYFTLDFENKLDSSKVKIADITNTLSQHYIHGGDDVYLIRFVSPDIKTYEYIIFCDAKTQQVRTKGNMLAFGMPLSFVERKVARYAHNNKVL
ncbi:hypothetical protein [Parapedobacter sp.]